MDTTTGARQGKADNVMVLKAKEKSEPIASFLKIRLIELTPGYAKVVMKISPEYLNFNNYIFGGIIMSLADQAFAYATNSLDYPSLASQVNIHFLAPAKVDDELIAECHVVKSGRRVAVSEMTVVNHDGKLIAKATGTTIPVSESSQ
jgi:acyl-CoA thioesterase